MLNVIPGKELEILHSRKGRFSILVDKVDCSVVTGTITKGFARYFSEANRVPGDTISVDTDSPFVKILCESSETQGPAGQSSGGPEQ